MERRAIYCFCCSPSVKLPSYAWTGRTGRDVGIQLYFPKNKRYSVNTYGWVLTSLLGILTRIGKASERAKAVKILGSAFRGVANYTMCQKGTIYHLAKVVAAWNPKQFKGLPNYRILVITRCRRDRDPFSDNSISAVSILRLPQNDCGTSRVHQT